MPVRMCCVCRAQKEKQEMIRIACPKDKEPQLDLNYRCSGRGAYICSEECLQQAKKRSALERTFKRKVSPEVYERILAGVTHDKP